MNLDYIQLLFWGLIILIFGRFLFKIIQKGGLRAALFGAPIEQTIGEIEPAHSKFQSIRLKVHRLKDESPERAVGLELITKSFASYHMLPLAISVEETRKLIGLLELSISGK